MLACSEIVSCFAVQAGLILCSTGWLKTHGDLPASDSQVLGIQAHAIILTWSRGVQFIYRLAEEKSILEEVLARLLIEIKSSFLAENPELVHQNWVENQGGVVKEFGVRWPGHEKPHTSCQEFRALS